MKISQSSLLYQVFLAHPLFQAYAKAKSLAAAPLAFALSQIGPMGMALDEFADSVIRYLVLYTLENPKKPDDLDTKTSSPPASSGPTPPSTPTPSGAGYVVRSPLTSQLYAMANPKGSHVRVLFQKGADAPALGYWVRTNPDLNPNVDEDYQLNGRLAAYDFKYGFLKGDYEFQPIVDSEPSSSEENTVSNATSSGEVPRRNVSAIISGNSFSRKQQRKDYGRSSAVVDHDPRRLRSKQRLVGIEENPGPPKTKKNKQSSKNGSIAALVKSVKAGGFKATARPANTNMFTYSQSRPTFTKILGAAQGLRHRGRDLDGIRVAGHQILANLQQTNTLGGIFTAVTGGATLESDSVISITPDAFNGRLAALANLYDKYLFRKLKIYFVPRVASTDVGSFMWALMFEGTTTFTPTFASISQLKTSCLFQSREPCQLTAEGPSLQGAEEVYFCEQDAATLAGGRQTRQARLFGIADETGATGTNVQLRGAIMVEYVVDFYDSIADQGVTIRDAANNKIRLTFDQALLAVASARRIYGQQWPVVPPVQPLPTPALSLAPSLTTRTEEEYELTPLPRPSLGRAAPSR